MNSIMNQMCKIFIDCTTLTKNKQFGVLVERDETYDYWYQETWEVDDGNDLSLIIKHVFELAFWTTEKHGGEKRDDVSKLLQYGQMK